jgi:sulfur carrier protein
MDIIVNGEKLELEEGVTLFALIARFGGIDKVMAAAVNMEIVKKEDWDKKVILGNDKIELLQFVGGG